MVLAETNTDFSGRVRWLADLRRMLRGMPWIRAVMWSQLPSRGKVQQEDTGVVDWDVQRDPAAAAELRWIILRRAALSQRARRRTTSVRRTGRERSPSASMATTVMR